MAEGILCPACFKAGLKYKNDLSKTHLQCPRCGEEFIKTGPNSVKFKES